MQSNRPNRTASAKLPAKSVTTYRRPTCHTAQRAYFISHVFWLKSKKHLKGELPKSYQRNFCKGFDRFVCLHLGVDPEQVIACVREASNAEDLDVKLLAIFPKDMRVHVWNRELVQKGMSEMGREALTDAKRKMGVENRTDLISFADMIDFDEGRIL